MEKGQVFFPPIIGLEKLDQYAKKKKNQLDRPYTRHKN